MSAEDRRGLDGSQGLSTRSRATFCDHSVEMGTTMTIKRILVHLNDVRRAQGLLAPAVALARQADAELWGVHVSPGMPLLAAPSIPYGADVVDAVAAAERRAAEKLSAVFHVETGELGARAQWRVEQARQPDLAECVMNIGRAADLIVASQADPDWDMAPVLDFPERLALESGRPVLMVPRVGRFADIPRNLLIAWNGKREAARAAFDVLALLPPGSSARLLVLDDGSKGAALAAGAEMLAQTFRLHGVDADVRIVAIAGRPIGRAIMDECTATGADLLAMGAYGHTRFRELVFGGATRYVTHNLAIPTLFSH